MPDYLYLTHPFRDGFFEQPTRAEEKIMDERLQYLQRAAEAGIVVLAGPCLDQTFDIVIFRAANDAAARQFMFTDPSVTKNVMLAELHPLHISLLGKD
jgi:uncharacterized protein YciI